eukprot:186414-Chlamydomonas_euryale.AAC.1
MYGKGHNAGLGRGAKRRAGEGGETKGWGGEEGQPQMRKKDRRQGYHMLLRPVQARPSFSCAPPRLFRLRPELRKKHDLLSSCALLVG